MPVLSYKKILTSVKVKTTSGDECGTGLSTYFNYMHLELFRSHHSEMFKYVIKSV